MKEYYDRRAPIYDDWWLGRGVFATRDAASWEQDVATLHAAIEALPPGRTLDVACGTGFLTQHLRGDVVGLDNSEAMMAIARSRVPGATFVRGDGLALPFANGVFDRIFTSHFYGHLDQGDRARFLAEAKRVARELVVVDAALRPDHEAEERQERALPDGTTWRVLKRYFAPDVLVRELGGGDVLHDGEWFVAVRVHL